MLDLSQTRACSAGIMPSLTCSCCKNIAALKIAKRAEECDIYVLALNGSTKAATSHLGYPSLKEE